MNRKQEDRMMEVSSFIWTLRTTIDKLDSFLDDWKYLRRGNMVVLRMENSERVAAIELSPKTVGEFLIPAFKSIKKSMEQQIGEMSLPGVAVPKALPKSKKKKTQHKRKKTQRKKTKSSGRSR